MPEQKDNPVRIPIPAQLYNRLIDAIGHRAMHLVGEQHPKRSKQLVSRADLSAMQQARDEAIQEAIEDWLAKPKDKKWL